MLPQTLSAAACIFLPAIMIPLTLTDRSPLQLMQNTLGAQYAPIRQQLSETMTYSIKQHQLVLADTLQSLCNIASVGAGNELASAPISANLYRKPSSTHLCIDVIMQNTQGTGSGAGSRCMDIFRHIGLEISAHGHKRKVCHSSIVQHHHLYSSCGPLVAKLSVVPNGPQWRETSGISPLHPLPVRREPNGLGNVQSCMHALIIFREFELVLLAPLEVLPKKVLSVCKFQSKIVKPSGQSVSGICVGRQPPQKARSLNQERKMALLTV